MDAVGGSWAGTFACSLCRRKRLTAEAFSGSQLRQLRERKLSEEKLKCKECVTAAQTAERERYYAVQIVLEDRNNEAQDREHLTLPLRGDLIAYTSTMSAYLHCFRTRVQNRDIL